MLINLHRTLYCQTIKSSIPLEYKKEPLVDNCLTVSFTYFYIFIIIIIIYRTFKCGRSRVPCQRIKTRKCGHAYDKCPTKGAQRTIGDKFSPLSELPSVSLRVLYTTKLIKRVSPSSSLTTYVSASMIRRSSNASVPVESTSSQRNVELALSLCQITKKAESLISLSPTSLPR